MDSTGSRLSTAAPFKSLNEARIISNYHIIRRGLLAFSVSPPAELPILLSATIPKTPRVDKYRNSLVDDNKCKFMWK